MIVRSRIPRLVAALLAVFAVSASVPGLAGEAAAVPPTSLEQAHEDYAAGRYRHAFEAYARLADAGDVEAARLATLMVRYGPDLHGEAFFVSADRARLWRSHLESAARARNGARD